MIIHSYKAQFTRRGFWEGGTRATGYWWDLYDENRKPIHCHINSPARSKDPKVQPTFKHPDAPPLGSVIEFLGQCYLVLSHGGNWKLYVRPISSKSIPICYTKREI